MGSGSSIGVVLGLMSRLLPAGRAVTAIKASALAGGILLLAGLALLASIGMGCAALWSAVDQVYGAADASLTVAGALLSLGLILLLVAWWAQRRGRKPEPSGLPPEQVDAIVKGLANLVGEHKAGALMAAVLAGVAAEQAARRP